MKPPKVKLFTPHNFKMALPILIRHMYLRAIAHNSYFIRNKLQSYNATDRHIHQIYNTPLASGGCKHNLLWIKFVKKLSAASET